MDDIGSPGTLVTTDPINTLSDLRTEGIKERIGIIHTFGNAPDIVGYLDAVLVVFGLYLFVVLVILPGNRGENRYGPVPKPD